MGKSLLAYELERLRRATTIAELVVATTDREEDIAIVSECARLGVSVHRGDSEDVLGRFWGAARAFGAEVIVRVTADCPLIDPVLLDQLVEAFGEGPDAYDYMATDCEHGYPRGLDCEVFSRAALDRAHLEARDPREREHVTAHFYANPDRFKLGGLKPAEDLSRHRWTVDTAADFELIDRILRALHPANPGFRWTEVLELVESKPDWQLLNRDVVQKAWRHAP